MLHCGTQCFFSGSNPNKQNQQLMKKSIRKLFLTGLILPAICALVPFAQTTSLAQVLTNRWSFSEPAGSLTVTDSVSGMLGTLQGTAQIDGAGNLVLDGGAGFVALPGGLISSLSNVTIEAWFTNSSTPDNVCLFSFDDGTGAGVYNGGSWNGHLLRMVLHDQGNTENYMQNANSGDPSSPGFGNQSTGSKAGLGDQTLHLVCVYDPVGGTAALYTNGVLETSLSGITGTLSIIPTNSSSLGQSPYGALAILLIPI